jgi:hypothetical protein
MFPVRYEHCPSCVLNKMQAMDNIQNCDSYMPSSQIYRCYSCKVYLSYVGRNFKGLLHHDIG